MARNTIGSKYESVKNLSRVEIAKLIRQDVKAAIAKHELPQIKISLRVTGYNALTLRVTEMSDGILLYNPEYLEAEYVIKDFNWLMRNREPGRYTVRASAILSTLTAIMEAYNFDKSEIETDYFHVNFYGSVDFCSELTNTRIKSEMEPEIFARNLKIVRDQREAAFVKREQERVAAEAREAAIRRQAQEERIQEEQRRAEANPPTFSIPSAPPAVMAPRRESIAEAAERVRLEEERTAAINANRPRVELLANLNNWRSRQTINTQRQRISRVALFFACMACNSSGRDVNHRICTYCAGDRETTNAQNQRFIDAKEAEFTAMPPLRTVPHVPERPTETALNRMAAAQGQGLSTQLAQGPVTLTVPISAIRSAGTPIAHPAKAETPQPKESESPLLDGIADRFSLLELD